MLSHFPQVKLILKYYEPMCTTKKKALGHKYSHDKKLIFMAIIFCHKKNLCMGMASFFKKGYFFVTNYKYICLNSLCSPLFIYPPKTKNLLINTSIL